LQGKGGQLAVSKQGKKLFEIKSPSTLAQSMVTKLTGGESKQIRAVERQPTKKQVVSLRAKTTKLAKTNFS
jgi:hypothetical protein